MNDPKSCQTPAARVSLRQGRQSLGCNQRRSALPPRNGDRKGDAVVRRQVAHWRRVTARLQVLINCGAGSGELAGEAHALSRQCVRLAADLASLAGRRSAAADSRGRLDLPFQPAAETREP